ncbi:hypothetical protein Bca101_053101 [Brassica carinata]
MESTIVDALMTKTKPKDLLHGLRQYRSGWADGPAYITQCPIRSKQTYTYRFKVEDQRGTLLWHAHHSWQRASVYGAFIIYPRKPYPFSGSHIQSEIPIILDTFTANVDAGKTYILRVINAALNNELFFAVSNHTLTVVEVDAVYTKPVHTKAIMIAPGQTTTLLLRTNNHLTDGEFLIAATPYVTSVFPFNNSTTVGFLRYNNNDKSKPVVNHLNNNRRRLTTTLSTHAVLPDMLDTKFATRFSDSIKSLGTEEYPCRVPTAIDKRVVTTISLNLQDCPENHHCEGYNGKRFFASMNNVSFIRPPISVLESYYKKQSKGVFTLDFPEKPPKRFDFTGVNPVSENMNTEFGTKLFEVEFGARLEIVFQGTSFLNVENHPLHVHGHNFFVVGRGFGNFDEEKDPAKYNLVDPPERNTVAVPTGGWAAIRINADNPGVWFIHCHLEQHTSWGLAMGFIVKDGPLPSQTLLRPPRDLPKC